MIPRPCTWPDGVDELRAHLMRPLADGGHGFESGIPVTDPSNFATLHEDDHGLFLPDPPWWQAALTHNHDAPPAERERAAGQATKAGQS